ncbi:MAG: hypothetical protein WB679_03615 [Terracidiphilus sp.]
MRTLLRRTPGKRPYILDSYLQIALFVSIAVYLGQWIAELHRRNARSWDAMVARLRLNSSKGGSSADLAAEMDRCFTSEEIAKRALTAQGRRAMFREAGVMLEMADYAERNGGAEIAPLVARLRSHALAIRMGTLKKRAGPR